MRATSASGGLWRKGGDPIRCASLRLPSSRSRNTFGRDPFGSIPAYQDGALTLSESGAIVLHISQQDEGLLPTDAAARARSIMWMFAGLSTVEPPIAEREAFMLREREKNWFEDRLPLLDADVGKRLGELASRLGDDEWLGGAFSGADLLMVTALRRLEASNIPERAGLLHEFRNLPAYVERGKARAAYRRAFQAQAAVYKQGVPSK